MGELARRPGCPEVAKTPLELLTPRPGEGFTKLEKMAWPLLGVITGVGMIAGRNIFIRRPWWSGFYLHVISGGVGYYLSIWVRDERFAAKAEADAVLRHYITLHPDDFPPFERKRWKDVYMPFEPYR